jgi:hypothetical protein
MPGSETKRGHSKTGNCERWANRNGCAANWVVDTKWCTLALQASQVVSFEHRHQQRHNNFVMMLHFGKKNVKKSKRGSYPLLQLPLLLI